MHLARAKVNLLYLNSHEFKQIGPLEYFTQNRVPSCLRISILQATGKFSNLSNPIRDYHFREPTDRASDAEYREELDRLFNKQ